MTVVTFWDFCFLFCFIWSGNNVENLTLGETGLLRRSARYPCHLPINVNGRKNKANWGKQFNRRRATTITSIKRARSSKECYSSLCLNPRHRLLNLVSDIEMSIHFDNTFNITYIKLTEGTSLKGFYDQIVSNRERFIA